MAWSACNDLHRIWLSQPSEDLKLKMFRVTKEPILMYDSETWTMKKNLESSLQVTVSNKEEYGPYLARK